MIGATQATQDPKVRQHGKFEKLSAEIGELFGNKLQGPQGRRRRRTLKALHEDVYTLNYSARLQCH